jgi:AcrR family transcriptional regulator
MNIGITQLRVRRKQQTRSEIVSAAFELFGRLGYETVSMESVAAAAGISRATLFNYFPQKELILREIAAARVEKLKRILEGFVVSGQPPAFERIVELVVKLSEENARITGSSKKLLLQTILGQASQGLLLAARNKAINVLAKALKQIPGRKTNPQLAAEMVFCVYIATMLEWLMREKVSHLWLVETMRKRLEALQKGMK